MARKKRSIVTNVAPEADTKNKPRYRDSFQQNVGRKVEEAGKKLEGHRKNILYGVAALVVLAVIIGIFYSWNSRSKAAAQAALGKAIETADAQVTSVPPTAGTTAKSFKTSKERSEAAIAEFQAVADQYGGAVGEKAKYFAAVNRLNVDRPAGIQELESLSKSSDDVGKLAKFALAQTRADDGRPEEAVTLYQELLATADPIVSKDTISLALANIYEKQGRKPEAVDILFGVVKAASEAKDLEGKPAVMSPAANAAKDKLKQLDPEKAKEIPEPVSETPGGPDRVTM
ncbi:MAG: tetratricopeptide repeat protein [Pyrinomonadaceae bacterium]